MSKAYIRAAFAIAVAGMHIEAGQIFETDDADAKTLTALGRAVPVSPEDLAAFQAEQAAAAKPKRTRKASGTTDGAADVPTTAPAPTDAPAADTAFGASPDDANSSSAGGSEAGATDSGA
jgi:hypothetical protein